MDREKLIMKLSDLADKHGLDPGSFLNHPKLLKGTGIKVEDISPAVIHSAEKYGQSKTTRMIERFNKDNTFPCFLVPSDYPVRLLDGVLRSSICGFQVYKFLGFCHKEGFKNTSKVQRILGRYGKALPDSVVETILKQGVADNSLEMSEEEDGTFFEIFANY